MAKKSTTATDVQRERARQLGTEARKSRFVLNCPYAPGSELAAIWEAARYPNRRAMPEEKVPVETLVERLNKHFRG